MSKQLRISIIIPAYNEERYVGRCLESIAAQKLQPYEVIVVDNNSTDGTVAAAQRYPFVRVMREKRQGRSFAQATGFDTAQGDVVARIDADAVLPPDWTERIARHFARPGALETAWTSGPSFYNVRFSRRASSAYSRLAFGFTRWLVGYLPLWGSSMALPRKLWQGVRGDVCMRPDLHEDLDLAIHLHRSGHDVTYDPDTKVGAELRPAYAGVSTLWEYLKLWPRTLRVHGIRTWPVCWPVNLMMFVGMPLFGIADRVARLFGRRPLEH